MNLKNGDKGAAVTRLQLALKNKGFYKLKIDKEYNGYEI